MIYLKLRQAGELVNHKRVERLYALEKLQVRAGGAKYVRPSIAWTFSTARNCCARPR
jgi:hypothetical protein